MSLPPRFLDELRERVTLSDLIGKRVKLIRKGHEYSGLCPFHHEKTPSFTINDTKGFYHCFGCGAHGDAIKFLMEHDKMPFMEAVEILARLAGLKVPQSPRDRAADEARHNLSLIMEEACHFFEENLYAAIGVSARTYLKGRGLNGALARRFRLGYAPSGSGLTALLQAKGFDMEACRALGLCVYNEARHQWHDYFYDRIMFPIMNRRGRVIGFGGRIMGKGEPKYLNSPETELFHKGEQLYALNQAVDSIRKQNAAILVEGYMDVIALHAAGFTNAVAPLGTALTENQIRLLWGACDEPTICFDGDMAGRKASVRALMRALPVLIPGKSLRFTLLPEPFDPDDMIHKKSPEDFKQALKSSLPLTEMLWRTLLEGRSLTTPERMAKFEKDIENTVRLIQNETVRGYYKKDFKNRLWHLQRQGHAKRRLPFEKQALPAPAPFLATVKMLLAYAYCWPSVTQDFIDEISTVHMPAHPLVGMLMQVLSHCASCPDITASALKEMEPKGVEAVRDELEMLIKSNRSDQEARQELKDMIQACQIHLIQQEVDLKTQEYLVSKDTQVWQEILDLKKEIEKRSVK